MIIALIPAYNEEKTIKEVVKRCYKYADVVIVVDDGSKDKTFELAKKAGAIVIRHKKNQGKGEALKTGFKFILNNFESFEKVVVIDADLQYYPEEIPKFLEKNANMIMGYRNWREVPFRHKLANFLWRKVFNFLFKTNLKDVACGFQAYDRKAIKTIINDIKGGYLVETSILISAIKNKLKLKQVPVKVVYKKVSGIRRGVRMFFGILIFLILSFLRNNK